MLRLTDLAAASAAAHARGVAVAVDNTFASPYVQRPIDFGADLVIHSTTKFLNGHSDSVGGVVVAVRDDHIEWLRFVQNAEGAILGPMDAWLVLRGTKTLPIRMERHNENAQALAEYLARHPKVTRVHYPGLPTHPQHELAQASDARVRRPDLVRVGDAGAGADLARTTSGSWRWRKASAASKRSSATPPR